MLLIPMPPQAVPSLLLSAFRVVATPLASLGSVSLRHRLQNPMSSRIADHSPAASIDALSQMIQQTIGVICGSHQSPLLRLHFSVISLPGASSRDGRS